MAIVRFRSTPPCGGRRESHNGLSLRVVKDYDIDTDDDIIRIDLLYGRKAIYPDLACRLWG